MDRAAHLDNKDLWFPHEALALVSLEQGRHVLDADLAVVGEHVIVLAVAQEGEQEAVGIRMVLLGGCRYRPDPQDSLSQQN